MRVLFLLAALAASALPLASGVQAQSWGTRPSRTALISSCEGCHGRNGETRDASVPRLNGQTREYLIARLRDLRIPQRQGVGAIHNMLTPARGVGEADIAAVAEHFATQPPTSPNRPAQQRRAGAQIYARGVEGRFPSCVSCHGDAGQGIGEAARLAGQHGDYLQGQLEALLLTARVQPGMNRHAGGMMPDEIRALVGFLAND